MASMEELYNTIADIWDSYDIYRQEHADKYGEAEESPSTIEQIKRHFYYVEKNKAGGLIPKIKNKINLDLELKETDSPEEKWDKLWLLEQIYVAEKIGVYRYSAKNAELPEREFLSRCKVLDIIANPKGMYVYNNYDDYDNEIMDAFETVYINVREAVKNADEIENTVDDLYNNWTLMNAISYLGVGLSSAYQDKLSEIKKQRDAVERIAFDPNHFISEQKNTEKSQLQTYTNVKERFFLMMVTAIKRAEINDRLFINFDYTKVIDSSYSGMDTRVVEELLENEFYKKEVSFEEFLDLLRSGSDEEKLYLWRVITSKYDPVIPGKEFFQSRGEFSKIIKYMENLIEPNFSFSKAQNSICQWCKLFKSVCEGMQYEGKLETYNWKGTRVEKTFPAIFKSYSTDRNVKSLTDSSEGKHTKRTERADRREWHSKIILEDFISDCELKMYSSPEIVECRNAIKKHMLLVMQKSFSCLFQTLNDIRKANSIIQFVFMMSTYSDEVMTICDWIFKRGFWDNFTFVVNEILHRKYRVLNPYYIPPIAQQQYNILYCNESVKRRLLSILASQSTNPNISHNFDALQLIIVRLCQCVAEIQDSEIVNLKLRTSRLCPFCYMCIHMEIYITIDHFNKTITIDDCIFKEPYEQELRQYL